MKRCIFVVMLLVTQPAVAQTMAQPFPTPLPVLPAPKGTLGSPPTSTGTLGTPPPLHAPRIGTPHPGDSMMMPQFPGVVMTPPPPPQPTFEQHPSGIGWDRWGFYNEDHSKK